jgi:beta-aspartyl-peptidase (threonine type)
MKFLVTILIVFFITYSQSNSKKYSIALHGGAGAISKKMSEELKSAYLKSLERALFVGDSLLKNGVKSINVVVQVIQLLEDNPLFNAGRGAVYTSLGEHELDASIMDGSNLENGAVTGVRHVKSPILLARKVMDESHHVLFAGAGAEKFAEQFDDIDFVKNSYFDTESRLNSLKRAKKNEVEKINKKGTVGVAALDIYGNLAAGTSTGGMTNKRFGRIGDSPIIGAGTYANNNSCAISSTGTGEEFIRHNVAFHISALMQYKNMSLEAAAKEVVFNRLKKGDGGIIAVDKDGNIAHVFNTLGMFRGKANSSGLFNVSIWED